MAQSPSNFLLSSTFLLLFSLLIILHTGHAHGHPTTKLTKLFVFGDSYADTGNIPKTLGSSWSKPYGVTFPGKPTGRFSDGRVFTDFFARFFGLKSPISYRWLNYAGERLLRHGMNFAYGGSGVFNTLGDLLPNMTTQMDFYQRLVDNSVYTTQDLRSSVVLVCLSGNDYAFYLATGGTPQGLPAFIPTVISQLSANIKRIHDMGATKIAVTALQPVGCLPRLTVTSSFQQCNTTMNAAVTYHNLLLQQAVANLNNQTGTSTAYVVDFYTSFTSVLNQHTNSHDLQFETPLRPCCTGVTTDDSCGSVDANGTLLYTVCSDPKSSFFWDSSHPTEAGWHAVYMTLKSSLEQFFSLY